MLLCYKMRLFPLVLAIWNIERHNAFAQGIQELLRESTYTEILIVPFFFFLPYGQWLSGNMTPLFHGQPWASYGGHTVNVFG